MHGGSKIPVLVQVTRCYYSYQINRYILVQTTMKLNFGIILIITQATTIFSTATPRDDGPADVDGKSPPAKDLFAPESCWTRSPYGCSDSRWCWKQCGPNGEWCWLAKNWGKGEWKSCSRASDSVPGSDNSDCGQGNCKACGCSC
ncbi:hypothetical protein BDV34DRAFT_218203 [Aspergillus parasiticus]|uniref:Uncharacterized protein n=1 Tax=Aspergillus parasiticus TaxID=5067 RepID=A0A5N6D1Y0_ASPPA|nr:hypothetical protein BDV34DRAFT_218203 [Aspergillus parasiticus]